MEIEFALPNELQTVEQYRQIIDAFIEKHLKDHYYAYAIHNKFGTMSNGQHHPPVHVMFSERLIDYIEKIKELLDKFFPAILRERKKMALNRLFKKSINAARLKIVNGLINLFFLFFVPTLLKFKMKYWRKMAFQSVLTIVP